MPGSRSARTRSSAASEASGVHAPRRVRRSMLIRDVRFHERNCRTAALRRPAGEPARPRTRGQRAAVNTGPIDPKSLSASSIGLVHVLMRMTPEDQFDRQPWRGASGALITADLRLDNRDDVLARIGSPPREATGVAGFARAARSAGKSLATTSGRCCAARSRLRSGIREAHIDAGARPSRAQRRDVAQERTILRLRHHAEWPVRAARRAARTERGEIRRFPGAQSRRPRDDDLPEHISCSSGACDAGRSPMDR